MPTEALRTSARNAFAPDIDFLDAGSWNLEPYERKPLPGYPERLAGTLDSDWATGWMRDSIDMSAAFGSTKDRRLAKFPKQLPGLLDSDWGAEWMSGEGSCCDSCAAGGECEVGTQESSCADSALNAQDPGGGRGGTSWDRWKCVDGRPVTPTVPDRLGEIGGGGGGKPPKLPVWDPPWWDQTIICTVTVICRPFDFPVAEYFADHCWIDVIDCDGTHTSYEVTTSPAGGTQIGGSGSYLYRDSVLDWRDTPWGRRELADKEAHERRHPWYEGPKGWTRNGPVWEFGPSIDLLLAEDCIPLNSLEGGQSDAEQTACDCVHEVVPEYTSKYSYWGVPRLGRAGRGDFNCNSFVQWVANECGLTKDGKPYKCGGGGAERTPPTREEQRKSDKRAWERQMFDAALRDFNRHLMIGR